MSICSYVHIADGPQFAQKIIQERKQSLRKGKEKKGCGYRRGPYPSIQIILRPVLGLLEMIEAAHFIQNSILFRIPGKNYQSLDVY